MKLPHEPLPSYSLFITPQDLHELRRDVWCEDPVSARLKMKKDSYHIGLAYRGSHTRTLPKKSYFVQFLTPSTCRGARECHLNAEFLDPSLMRNKLSLDFFQDLRVLSPDAQHIDLTLNGGFAGVYLQFESVDDLFMKKRGRSLGPIYYAVNDDANFSLISPIDKDVKSSLLLGYQRKFGTSADDEHLQAFLYRINTLPRSDFAQEIRHDLNVEAYLRWLVGVVCTQNFDAFIQNYALYRDAETGLHEIIPWDFDATWGRDCNGEVMPPDYVPLCGYNTLTARLLDCPDYRKRYRELMTETLENHFTPAALEPSISMLHATLRPYVARDPHISRSMDRFDAEPEFILQFVQDRNLFLRETLRTFDT
jgi:spore coat protein H